MPRIAPASVLFSLFAVMTVCQAGGVAPAATDYRVISRIPLGGPGGWDYLTVDAQRHRLFISRGDRVAVVDVQQGKQIGSIAATAGVHGIALAQDLHRGFTSNGSSASVTVFDLDSLRTLETIAGTGEHPDAILYDAASHHVLTFNGKSHSASVINPATHAVIATIALPGKPEFAVADGHGHVLVNIEDTSALVQIDSINNTPMHTWPLAPCQAPSGLAIDRARHRLFAVCDNRTMAVVDALDGHLIATLPIGDGPDAVVFDDDTSMAYSANGESGTITAVHQDDADHYRVVATIPTLPTARTLALDPASHRLYLSAARQEPAGKTGGRPAMVPGSFTILTVGQR